MENKEKSNRSFRKIFSIYGTLLIVLTFFSKSFYNYRLPEVTVALPMQGNLNFIVEGNAEVLYSNVSPVYADTDGRIKEILVKNGEKIEKGQCLMKLEVAGTGKMMDVIAEKNGTITSVGVEKGMYVSSMQNIILYKIAETSKEWMCTMFITEEQVKCVDGESDVTVRFVDTGERVKGEIQSVMSYAEQNKTGYRVILTIHSENVKIAGKRVNVTIRKESMPYDTIIPAEALHKDNIGYYVLALRKTDSVLGKGYVARRISVDLLDSDEKYSAVRGLPSDEYIIVSATSEISDGKQVFCGERLDE